MVLSTVLANVKFSATNDKVFKVKREYRDRGMDVLVHLIYFAVRERERLNSGRCHSQVLENSEHAGLAKC